MKRQYTQEEVVANYASAIKRLLPAVLKNTLEDRAFVERLVTQHILANDLEPTEDNLYAAFKHHYRVLPWQIKLAVLLREEENDRVNVNKIRRGFSSTF